MVIFEVEQKFCFRPRLHRVFRLNGGTPPFSQLRCDGMQRFYDCYYDKSRVLDRHGIWLRERDGEWEVKERVEGDHLRTAFREIRDISRIHSLVRQHIPGSPGASQKFGLNIFCAFETTRHRYTVDDRFTVVLDETDFGHNVGEVELMTDDIPLGHEEISRFLTRYRWFFGEKEKPKGKLTAYFEKFGYNE